MKTFIQEIQSIIEERILDAITYGERNCGICRLSHDGYIEVSTNEVDNVTVAVTHYNGEEHECRNIVRAIKMAVPDWSGVAVDYAKSDVIKYRYAK